MKDILSLDCKGFRIQGNNQNGIGITSLGRKNITIKNCGIGNFNYGIFFENTMTALISNNTLSNNNVSIKLTESNRNIIITNTIFNNTLGIWLDPSFDNSIYNNNLINNSKQAFDDGKNAWFHETLGGNYWSDFDSSGEGCNDQNSDGKCDIPYNIQGGNNADKSVFVQESGWSPQFIKFIREDSNGDGKVDISDPINTLNFLFLGTGKLECKDSADANDDNKTDISDAVYTLSFLFTGGPIIKLPYPNVGIDPTMDSLTCEAYNPPAQAGEGGGGGGSAQTVKDALNETKSNKTMNNQTKSFLISYLEAIPKGNLSISSSPSYAYIYIDNSYKGLTPKIITNLTAGNYTLRLTKYGYQEYKTILNIQPSKVTKLSPTLLQQLSPTPSPSPSPSP